MNHVDSYQKASAIRDCREASLLEILQAYRLCLPANAIEWRVPPEPQTGTIRGITRGSVRLLCLDGVVAWFAFSDGTTLFGHIGWFEVDKETKERQARKGPTLETRKKYETLADQD